MSRTGKLLVGMAAGALCVEALRSLHQSLWLAAWQGILVCFLMLVAILEPSR